MNFEEKHNCSGRIMSMHAKDLRLLGFPQTISAYICIGLHGNLLRAAGSP
jgi:hypothetical protein